MVQYQFYSITEEPIQIFGLHVVEKEKRQFYRLPMDMLRKMPQYRDLGRRAVGGRARFSTNSSKILIRMTLAQAKEDIYIPLAGSAGADVYVGSGREARYLGCVAPESSTRKEIVVEKQLCKSSDLELITINFPRNDWLLGMEIGIELGSIIQKAPAYQIEKPILYYGSSITEGGCASRVGNAYTSIVSRWLDADYYNFGFSGSAKGEEVFAQYLAELPQKSMVVLDYDHNAPDVAYLKQTHKKFFQIIREKNPDLPILMISRPDIDKEREDSKQRRDVIVQTYEYAIRAGDKQVYFIDGAELFGEFGRAECTVDGTHPNTLGFMRMAEKIYPVMKRILIG